MGLKNKALKCLNFKPVYDFLYVALPIGTEIIFRILLPHDFKICHDSLKNRDSLTFIVCIKHGESTHCKKKDKQNSNSHSETY